MPSTPHVDPTAKCAADTIFGETARWWLTPSCRQQCCDCHNLATAARLKQGQQYCGSHDVVAGKIVAGNPATSKFVAENPVTMPAALWRSNIKTLHRYY